MIAAILVRPCRDSAFQAHSIGEEVTVLSRFRRADFDDTVLIKVRFASNGALATLLETDVREDVSPLPVPGAHDESPAHRA